MSVSSLSRTDKKTRLTNIFLSAKIGKLMTYSDSFFLCRGLTVVVSCLFLIKKCHYRRSMCHQHHVSVWQSNDSVFELNCSAHASNGLLFLHGQITVISYVKSYTTCSKKHCNDPKFSFGRDIPLTDILGLKINISLLEEGQGLNFVKYTGFILV